LGIWKKFEGIDLDFNILLKVDEHLGRYWECLRGQQQLRWYVKELY
jgi:hypothetical protein